MIYKVESHSYCIVSIRKVDEFAILSIQLLITLDCTLIIKYIIYL